MLQFCAGQSNEYKYLFILMEVTGKFYFKMPTLFGEFTNYVLCITFSLLLLVVDIFADGGCSINTHIAFYWQKMSNVH